MEHQWFFHSAPDGGGAPRGAAGSRGDDDGLASPAMACGDDHEGFAGAWGGAASCCGLAAMARRMIDQSVLVPALAVGHQTKPAAGSTTFAG